MCPAHGLDVTAAPLERAGLPAAHRTEGASSEHTCGGLMGRRCGTFLLYSLFDLFELRF
jgi:hypothetical protein